MSQVECLNCENKFIYNEDDEMPELCKDCKDLWECDQCGNYFDQDCIYECQKCGDFFCDGCKDSHNGNFEEDQNYGKCDECGEQLPESKEDHLYCDECQKFFDGESE